MRPVSIIAKVDTLLDEAPPMDVTNLAEPIRQKSEGYDMLEGHDV